MSDILTSINTRKTPQSKKAEANQVKNSAGGYVFQIGDEARLHRFLTLGTDGPSYYASAQDLTVENAAVVFRMAADKPDELIQAVVDVSVGGRAPKNKQAIFALAIAASAEEVTTRQKAMAVMHQVCRTGTHLFEFNKYVEQFRGRGRTLNRGVANWYLKKDEDKLAYQAVKYRSREDWTHRDLLRLVKPGQYGPKSDKRNALFDFIIGKDVVDVNEAGLLPAIVGDYLEAKFAEIRSDKKAEHRWVEIINRGNGMSWEMLPDAALKEPAVWDALISQGMPATALMRQLPRLTNVFGGQGTWINTVAAQLQDAEQLKRGRVHPVNVLIAQRTYQQGHGFRGKGSWTPISKLVDALDAGFYAAYGSVEPTGKRRLIALDVSGSMGSTIGDLPITAREASAALCLVSLATETEGSTDVIGFTSGGGIARSTRYGGYGRFEGHNAVSRLDITPRRRLDDVTQYVADMPFGATDCALPFTWADKQGLDFDSVEIYTDNETWDGPIHVHQAAENYRNKVGHDVKLVAVGMTSTNYSIVDPKDPSGLNVSGFDGVVPNLIGDFVADRL